MYAVIVTGGKQYRVMQGETLRVEKLEAEVGAPVKFDQVLLVGEGEKITVGVGFQHTLHGANQVIKHISLALFLVGLFQRAQFPDAHGRRRPGHGSAHSQHPRDAPPAPGQTSLNTG